MWAAQTAAVGDGFASEEPWLWLDLEEAAARAGAAAAIVALDIA